MYIVLGGQCESFDLVCVYFSSNDCTTTTTRAGVLCAGQRTFWSCQNKFSVYTPVQFLLKIKFNRPTKLYPLNIIQQIAFPNNKNITKVFYAQVAQKEQNQTFQCMIYDLYLL